jgi:uncharacterized membrane protein
MSPQQSKRSLAHARSTRPATAKRYSSHGVPKSKNVQIKTDESEEETMAASFDPFWSAQVLSKTKKINVS